jgi:hypothetical protein
MFSRIRGCSDKGDRSGNLAAEFETEITVITPPDANPEEDVFGGSIVKHVHRRSCWKTSFLGLTLLPQVSIGRHF